MLYIAHKGRISERMRKLKNFDNDCRKTNKNVIDRSNDTKSLRFKISTVRILKEGVSRGKGNTQRGND